MEIRKQKEIEYYDQAAIRQAAGRDDSSTDFEGFNPNQLSSYSYCYSLLKEKCRDKIVLDYGCGNGVHAVALAKMGTRKVVGIDLSEKSLEIARKRAAKEGMLDKIEFLVMDCEKMQFPDNFFDLVFDGGTFSSIDIQKTFPEIARVLKPSGELLGIETFGHNPLTNLKRKVNKIFGKRTGWAAEHILKMNDLDTAQVHFKKVEVHYFHLVSWAAFPLLSVPGSNILLKLLEFADGILLNMPFLRKYSFKIVFLLTQPKK